MNDWITLEDFLKNPIYGWCWITLKFIARNEIRHRIAIAYYDPLTGKFFYNDNFDDNMVHDIVAISDIMPITYPKLPTKYARNIE